MGNDTIVGIEDVWGGAGDDRIVGAVLFAAGVATGCASSQSVQIRCVASTRPAVARSATRSATCSGVFGSPGM